MNNQKTTENIKLWGIVQGVGFRPFVAKMAERFQMKGTVLNIGGLVEITLTDRPERITEFLHALQAEKPGPAEIVHIRRRTVEPVEFADFRIIESGEGSDEAAMIPPDMAICPHCLEELYDPENPRYLHPFISCMICGPRYTIIDRIPYDRDNTSMIDFPMCDFCSSQYTDLHDRRHHAQTISCHDCGPYLKWIGRGGTDGDGGCGEAPAEPAEGLHPGGAALRGHHTPAGDRELLDRAARILKRGGVIAFKCVGGYNLVADPFSAEGIRRLREIKGRESKPFAVLFRSLEQIRQYCRVDEVEGRLLESSARPIILLEHRLREEGFVLPRGEGSLQVEGTPAPCADDLLRSRFIGAFLPSLAAQYLLLDRTGPLVFTSANHSDLPMIREDADMRRWFEAEPKIDGILMNDRQIRVAVDDSVSRVIDGQPQMIRRSKGYAPLPLYLNVAEADDAVEAGSSAGLPDAAEAKAARRDPVQLSILAAGGQLKNSFVLSKGPFLYTSQYFGDMDTEENQEIYRRNVERMSRLFRIRPEKVACDLHPLYETTRFAEEYAKANRLPLIRVQHHHAHVASVMAENDLKGKVIGVSFDGTGYGTDGKIWGGEILLCEGGGFERFSHLRYVNMIGGDSSMKDARRSALSYMLAGGSSGGSDADESGCRQFTIPLDDILEFGGERVMGCPDARLITRAIEAGINAIQSSSMGRLFDAVSCLLGIQDYNRYEGQCAIMLEDAAAFAQKHPGEDRAGELALAFHRRVIDAIVGECLLAREKNGADQVALTGGTFQNKILMEGVLARLRELDFTPYYNISVSPNDGGIALGQAFVALHRD